MTDKTRATRAALAHQMDDFLARSEEESISTIAEAMFKAFRANGEHVYTQEDSYMQDCGQTIDAVTIDGVFDFFKIAKTMRQILRDTALGEYEDAKPR